MKKLLYYTTNRLWIALCRKDYTSYIKKSSSVKEVQAQILRDYLSHNKETAFGHQYDFKNILNPEMYQKKVPLFVYEDYKESIASMLQGGRQILTQETVKHFECSSGSSSASKYIPYTASLKSEFLKGINTWAYNLYTCAKGLYSGPAYWSITPLTKEKEFSGGGIPIGFEEDSAYFGFFTKFLLDFIFAVPSELKNIHSMDSFHYVTLLFLLKEKDLAFISIWNPSFLTLLLEPFDRNINQLIHDLEKGCITAPEPFSKMLNSQLSRKLGKQPKRAKEISTLYEAHSQNNFSDDSSLFERIWPQLKVISCWTDANAERLIPEIKRCFPHVVIQGKGLLSTEAFISIPFWGEEGARLAYRSHFFEFEVLDEDLVATGQIVLAHELQIDQVYSVVITTGSGFYRYKMQDLIRVIGFAGTCPRIKFMGKGDKVVDLFGEKLNEIHVQSCVESALLGLDLKARFYLVAPQLNIGCEPSYVLFIELELASDSIVLQAQELMRAVEVGFLENFHYDYCRQLGQLGPLKIFLIEGNDPFESQKTYIQGCVACGQREGNIKPIALHGFSKWDTLFNGQYIEDYLQVN